MTGGVNGGTTGGVTTGIGSALACVVSAQPAPGAADRTCVPLASATARQSVPAPSAPFHQKLRPFVEWITKLPLPAASTVPPAERRRRSPGLTLGSGWADSLSMLDQPAGLVPQASSVYCRVELP